jgi:chaperonin GroEL
VKVCETLQLDQIQCHLKRGIEKAVEAIADELLKMAKPVETKEQISATASISAADTTIG